MKKICIYAICKNEISYVDKWLDSMSEADYIVILDTGSTDGTYERLLNDERVFCCEQQIINPWRFDTARNASLELVPEDSDILMCTDLDEVLEPGWADVLRAQWTNEATRAYYKYTWKHNDNGDEENTFWYDKIHDKSYKWKYPVHEALYTPNEEYIIYLDDKVHLHHYPNGENRTAYLPLLELRAKENSDDYYGKFYLAREYGFYKRYEEGIELFKEIAQSDAEENTGIVKAGCYCNIGDFYCMLNQPFEAIRYYSCAIEVDPSYREPYLLMGETFNELKMYNAAIGIVKEGLQKSWRHYNWLERDASWREQADDILGIAYYYLDNATYAVKHSRKALNYNPTDERLQNNFELCLKLLDKE